MVKLLDRKYLHVHIVNMKVGEKMANREVTIISEPGLYKALMNRRGDDNRWKATNRAINSGFMEKDIFKTKGLNVPCIKVTLKGIEHIKLEIYSENG